MDQEVTLVKVGGQATDGRTDGRDGWTCYAAARALLSPPPQRGVTQLLTHEQRGLHG